jgi:hypothetical protein
MSLVNTGLLLIFVAAIFIAAIKSNFFHCYSLDDHGVFICVICLKDWCRYRVSSVL